MTPQENTAIEYSCHQHWITCMCPPCLIPNPRESKLYWFHCWKCHLLAWRVSQAQYSEIVTALKTYLNLGVVVFYPQERRRSQFCDSKLEYKVHRKDPDPLHVPLGAAPCCLSLRTHPYLRQCVINKKIVCHPPALSVLGDKVSLYTPLHRSRSIPWRTSPLRPWMQWESKQSTQNNSVTTVTTSRVTASHWTLVHVVSMDTHIGRPRQLTGYNEERQTQSETNCSITAAEEILHVLPQQLCSPPSKIFFPHHKTRQIYSQTQVRGCSRCAH